jgi:YgiT-type zinc finger domain-containing protein
MKDKLCALCGGEVVERTEVLVRQLADRGTVLIKDVPARVCKQCGHRWLTQSVMTELEALAAGQREPDSVEQVAVFSLT